MDRRDFSELSNQELKDEVAKQKKGKIFDAFAVGLLIGLSIWSTANKGFGIFTFIPLVYLPIASKNNKARVELNKLLEERGLNSE